MQTVQLLPNLRYVSMSDDEGVLGLFIHHEGETIYETYEVSSREAFVEVFNMFDSVGN